jgi:hypothetical protein
VCGEAAKRDASLLIGAGCLLCRHHSQRPQDPDCQPSTQVPHSSPIHYESNDLAGDFAAGDYRVGNRSADSM